MGRREVLECILEKTSLETKAARETALAKAKAELKLLAGEAPDRFLTAYGQKSCLRRCASHAELKTAVSRMGCREVFECILRKNFSGDKGRKGNSLGKSQGGTKIISRRSTRQIFGHFWTKILSEKVCFSCGTIIGGLNAK